MIGTVIGSYRVTEKIGQGGMGAVYRGLDVMLERDVAIKMLRPELARDPQIVERFRSEAIALARLNHPHIATVYSFLRQDDDYFMVMEYVRGDTLDNLLRNFGAMRLDRAVGLFCQALEGIGHAHKLGIIHRDIKPGNIMVTTNGTVKVMDFGIARVLGTTRITRVGHLVGTVEYMSPEQVRGGETDARSDIYALGIVLYEMLTGQVPFSSPSEFELMKAHVEKAPPPPRSFVPQIPLLIEETIMRALAKKPEARYQTAEEFRSALETSMRAATNPLEPVTPYFQAPATRASDSYIAPATAVDVPQQANASGTAEVSPVATGPQAQETGVVKAGQAPQINTAASASARATDEDISMPPESKAAQKPEAVRASFFSKLTWKHYAAAAAVILMLAALRLALISSPSAEVTPQAPPAVQPAAPPPPSPAQSNTSAPADKPAADASNQVDNSSRARSRNARGEKNGNEQAATKNEDKSVKKENPIKRVFGKLNPFGGDKKKQEKKPEKKP